MKSIKNCFQRGHKKKSTFKAFNFNVFQCFILKNYLKPLTLPDFQSSLNSKSQNQPTPLYTGHSSRGFASFCYASAFMPPRISRQKKKKKRKKNLLSRRKTKREKRIIPSEETINVTFTSREPIKILLSQYDAFPFLFSLRRWDHDPITRALKWPMDHPVHARINDGGHSPPLFSLKISFECASTPWRVIFWPERLRSCSERSIKPVNSRGWLTGHRGIVKGCFCAGTNELKMTSLFASRVKTTGGDRVSRNEHEMPVYFEVP